MTYTDRFNLRYLAGEYVLMPRNEYLSDGTSPLIINETVAEIVQEFSEGSDEQKVLAYLLSEYEVDEETLKPELESIYSYLKTHGVISD